MKAGASSPMVFWLNPSLVVGRRFPCLLRTESKECPPGPPLQVGGVRDVALTSPSCWLPCKVSLLPPAVMSSPVLTGTVDCPLASYPKSAAVSEERT